MWKDVVLKQILLITDGCSNMGEDPVGVAERARQRGIAVNVIGIVDGGTIGSNAEREVRDIAKAGGGTSRIVELMHLAQTMQMMTRHTVQMTLHQVVNKELQLLVGKEVEQLPPGQRMEVAHLVDRAGEEAEIRLVLLLDVSASMRDKLGKVRDAIRDLEIGLDARKGRHQVAVMTYPGQSGSVQLVSDFCENPGLSVLGHTLAASGGTPTGPALEEAIQLLLEGETIQDEGEHRYVV